MSKSEKELMEELSEKEDYLKSLREKINQGIKEKDVKLNSMEYLKNEFVTRRTLIQEKIRTIVTLEKDCKNNKDDGNQNNMVNDGEVMNEVIAIHKNMNNELSKTFSAEGYKLTELQKQMKINYLVLFKLEIKDDWMIKKKLEPNLEFFDKLKSLQAVGKLNYRNLKGNGNIIFFRILEDTTFKNIKENACQLWNISQQAYKMYDDSFCNLDLCDSIRVTDFFLNYGQIDKSVKPGIIYIYMLEKINYQNGYLDTHLNLIDTKSSENDDKEAVDNQGKGGELLQCIKYIREGTILKGINNYKTHKHNRNDLIKNDLKLVDNYHIYMLVLIAFLTLSIYSIQFKKNVKNYQNSYQQNYKIFTSLLYSNNTQIFDGYNFYTNYNFTDIRDFLYYYTNLIDKTLSTDSFYTFIGPIRFRFFRLNSETPCPSEIDLIPVVPDPTITNKCYGFSHSDDYRNKSGVYKYPFSENLNVTYTIKSSLMTYDTSGTVIEITKHDINWQDKLNDLYFLCQNYRLYLDSSLRAYEITFSYYNPFTDLFVTNFIVVERSRSGQPVVTFHEVIPFKINLYETSRESFFLKIDFIRLLLLVGLFSSVFVLTVKKCLNQVQKIGKKFIKGFLSYFYIFLETAIQIKCILLICALGLYIDSFLNFYNSSFNNSQELYNSPSYYDFYTFARNQKNSMNNECLSLYFIMIYSLKYIQVFSQSNLIFYALHKVVKEYFFLLVMIMVCFTGFSLCSYYLFCQNIYEYQYFLNSLHINFKIFIFGENNEISSELLIKSRSMTVVIYFSFLFLIRYFLLGLFYPILIERYIIESQNLVSYGENQGEEEEEFNFINNVLDSLEKGSNT